MRCMICGSEMKSTSGGNYICPGCNHSINDLVYRPSNCDMPWTQGFGQQGWICPVCGKGLAPWVSVCPCMTKELKITYGTDTTTDDYAKKELERLLALNDERVAEMISFQEEFGVED